MFYADQVVHETCPLTIIYNYLLYRKIKGILLYQEFPRPIVFTKYPEPSEGCFVGKMVGGTNGYVTFLIFKKVVLFYRLL